MAAEVKPLVNHFTWLPALYANVKIGELATLQWELYQSLMFADRYLQDAWQRLTFGERFGFQHAVIAPFNVALRKLLIPLREHELLSRMVQLTHAARLSHIANLRYFIRTLTPQAVLKRPLQAITRCVLKLLIGVIGQVEAT